jgi:hypothetical protein
LFRTTDGSACRIGLVMRQFAKDESGVDKSVKKLVSAVKNAFAFKDSGDEPLIDRIDIVIPTDKNYKQCDCGLLKSTLDEALSNELGDVDGDCVFVTEIAEGDNNVGVLNAALELQKVARVDFMLINSPSASGYLTEATALAMCRAWNSGVGVDTAWVVCAVLPETPHPTLAAMGIAQNTLAGYDVDKLSEINGFNKMAAIAPKGEPENPTAGLEEVPALFGMRDFILRNAGEVLPFVAFVEPLGAFTRWQLPQEGTEDRANHDKQHATKIERAKAHASALGHDLSELESLVIEKYRYTIPV